MTVAALQRVPIRQPSCKLGNCASPAADQTFAHHGIRYEIDLCMLHAAFLDFALEPFKQAAREIPDYQP